jgi:hypothetical protein
MNEDPEERREREFDAITFLLAGVLSAIVLGAIGYGIFNSSRVATTIPSLTADSPVPKPPDLPLSNRNDPAAPSRTTGSR